MTSNTNGGRRRANMATPQGGDLPSHNAEEARIDAQAEAGELKMEEVFPTPFRRRAIHGGPQDEVITRKMQEEGASERAYMEEYQLTCLHRLKMRGYPPHVIAKNMKITMVEYRKLDARLMEVCRDEVAAMDLPGYVARALAVYGEVQQQALKMFSDTGNTPMARLRAANTALNAANSQHTLMEKVGFFDQQRLNPAASGDIAHESANTLRDLAAAILDDDEAGALAILDGETGLAIDDDNGVPVYKPGHGLLM